MDGVVTRLNVPATAVAEPVAAAVVVTETANGGVTVRKAEETTAANEEKLILGKFKTPEDLQKAYVELEKKLGSGKKDEAPAPTAETPKVDAAAAAVKAGLDLAALSQEYTAGGNKLSDESLAKLAAAGITAEQVGTYIAGQQAIADKISADLATVTGGADKLTATLEWAKVNATPEQKAAFDAALDSNNPALVKMALVGIHADYIKANGNDPKFVAAETIPATSGVQPFGSQQEITAAMKDPRYKKGDQAYMKTVNDRMRITELWGKK